MKKDLWRFAVLWVALLIVGFIFIDIVHAATNDPLRYRELDGNGPRLVIRGEGCLQAEDSLRLRVVEYTGEKVIYRCIVP